jgi:hypothetical protein
MRPDDALSTGINSKLPPLPEGERLTPAHLAFAEVLGQILAERWTAIHRSTVPARLGSVETDARIDPREI